MTLVLLKDPIFEFVRRLSGRHTYR